MHGTSHSPMSARSLPLPRVAYRAGAHRWSNEPIAHPIFFLQATYLTILVAMITRHTWGKLLLTKSSQTCYTKELH
jgi:hypothetical protein